MSDSIQPAPSLRDAPADEPQSQPAPAPEATAERTDKPKDNTTQDAPLLDVKALTDRALQFLATASNEALGACLVGLSAATYLILGRFGLLLIGVAGGVVLHATWEAHAHGGEPKNSGQTPDGRRREIGVDVAHRVLDWRDKRGKDGEKSVDDDSDVDVKLYSGKELDFSDFRPETAAALTELTEAIIRDYVKWWYSPILPTENSFPDASRQTLTAFLISVSSHLARKRPADNFVDFVTRSSSFMIIFFQELSNAVLASPGDTASEAVDIYLKMKRDSTLANILDTDYQSRQFSVAAEDILQNYLEPKTYNCKPAQTFLHQILAKVVLEMIVASCSKPEWINGWIVYLLEDGEPELMNAIDASVEGSSPQLQNVKATIEKQENISPEAAAKARQHKRVASRAQQAMDDAMLEAQRLSQMIAEEDAKRLKDQTNASSSSLNDDQSESTTQGIATPTSSQSETLVDNDMSALGISGLSTDSPTEMNPPSPAKGSPIKAPEEPPKQEIKKSFTSFDQLVPQQAPTALMDNPPPAPPPLTLHNAKLTIFDDSQPGEKGLIKNKPTTEYLISIEPSVNYYTGWMSAKKYTDFETLHEVLRRIANITGTTGFMETHKDLPAWKNHTKASLRGELERYLNDAVKFKPLAESEGLKRFLDKDIGSGKSPGGSGLWPGQAFETMGKGMIDVLTKAPKEVAGGGKALFGGVTGVLGSVATPFSGAKSAKKSRDSVSNGSNTPSRASTDPIKNRHGRAESTVSELPTHIRTESTLNLAAKRTSTESLRNPNSPIIDQQPQREAPMERRPSYNPDGDGKRSGRSSIYGASRSNSRAPSVRESMDLSPTMGGDQILNLPPMPSEIPDDYNASPSRDSLDPYHSRHPSRASTTSLQYASDPLFFALTTELYTLSSAWSLRRTLLNAAKTFLLRPGNPQLTSIQALLQESVLDSNTSDAGIAYHLRKIRANALPTEDELKGWSKELGTDEKEKLRVKARKLLVERGMPQALTSVMGQAASGEALGKVFDALQVERVARGVIFGLVLQALRGITQ
ncbi:hypothetical protein K458DRAFT_424646 [Lentithecium fluviatile CBS 122367]|uniref:PXA domain-containing protein n=1 Tax=Lentithecium fluviatile CBS 122367 TaxID=1168545 RepID=A0A6G1IE82_9PLEO|nr:hypothetical protein K458DRAFT_424646 [Lentithecium fluviatile CBS 122367]